MFRLHFRNLLSRVPDTGYQSPTRVKWATYTFWYIVDPLLRMHFRYFRHKCQLDRMLEKNGWVTNVIVGVILGYTVYFGIVLAILPPLSATRSESNSTQSLKRLTISKKTELMREIAEDLQLDSTKELLPFLMPKAKRIIVSRIYETADVADLRRQQSEVAKIMSTLEQTESSE